MRRHPSCYRGQRDSLKVTVGFSPTPESTDNNYLWDKATLKKVFESLLIFVCCIVIDSCFFVYFSLYGNFLKIYIVVFDLFKGAFSSL